MILASTNNTDFTQTIDEQYFDKDSFHVIQACTRLLFTLLPIMLVSLTTPIPYTGHFHTHVNQVHNLS